MKTTLSIAILLFFLYSCGHSVVKSVQPDVKSEIVKWKKQLLLNGEIGTPCDFEHKEEWFRKNPEAFYGLPDTVSFKLADANHDLREDLLLYFPAGDACSSSNEQGSDFVKLIYSNGNETFTNDNLRDKIATKIEEKYYEQTNTDVHRAIFSIQDFNSEISGTYRLWTKEDPDCCASVEGKFRYNPFTFQIGITLGQAK